MEIKKKCKYCGRTLFKKDSRQETLVFVHRGCNSILNFNRDYWFAYFCYIKNISPEAIV